MLTKILVYLLLANPYQVNEIPDCVNYHLPRLLNSYTAAVIVQNSPSVSAWYLDHSVRRVIDHCTDVP